MPAATAACSAYHCREQRGLVGEVMVESAASDACRSDNVRGGSVGEAPFSKEFAPSLEEQPAGFGATFRLGASFHLHTYCLYV